jgi:hypothetical protein
VRRLTLTVLVAAMIGTAVSCTHGHENRVAPHASRSTSTAIDLGSDITFTTGLGASHPQISAVRAWSLYATHGKGHARRAIPNNTKPLLGRLTGSGEIERRVWAFEYRTPVGCLNTLTTAAGSQSKGCNEWTFLDANSGRHVLTTFRPIAK